jgi:cardiolipin synthase
VRYFLSTAVIVVAVLLIQLLLLLLLYMTLFFRFDHSSYYGLAYLFCHMISFPVVLIVINRRCPAAYKLSLIVPILLFPPAGAVLYLIMQSRSLHQIAKKRVLKARKLLAPPSSTVETPKKERLSSFSTLPAYLLSQGFPAFSGTQALFLESGEDYFSRLKEDLRQAKRFIFLEYFIIHEGVMWDEILEILEQKARSGVTVRLLYDGMGSLKTLPRGYCKRLKERGIDAKVFQKFVPLISTMQNNRDHRKIAVIDGKIAYTGGVNLADEYINEYDRFGHWLDSGLRLEGQGADQFTRFFLEMWYTNHPFEEEFQKFLGGAPKEAGGLVIPYNDAPLFEENCIKNLYLKMISSAVDYVYITTPYLVPGDELLEALCLAAKSGVDVRLITPHHGDHKIVHMISRSYYRELVCAGVRIYEYLPGFIHSKNIVCDDKIASVGTANLDYRSLFLHYECGALCLENDAVFKIKNNFLKTAALSKEISEELLPPLPPVQRLLISVMRLFEPML